MKIMESSWDLSEEGERLLREHTIVLTRMPSFESLQELADRVYAREAEGDWLASIGDGESPVEGRGRTAEGAVSQLLRKRYGIFAYQDGAGTWVAPATIGMLNDPLSAHADTELGALAALADKIRGVV